MSLTAPERFTQRAQDKKLVPIIKALGGCAVCTRRDDVLGLTCKDSASLTFPVCVGREGICFDLDREKLKEIIANASR